MNEIAGADVVAGTDDRSPRAIKGVLVLAVLVGVALRFYFVDSGLWYDEIVTLIDSVRMPLAQIVTHFPSNNDHPLYSVLARLSIVAFGEHAWSLRLPAVIFGVAALPMLYVFGTQITSRFEAVAATLLLATSYHHIWFSQNARGYTILLFCALLATHLLLIGLRKNRRAAYVGFAVVSGLAAYTHLTMVLFTLGQALVVTGHLLTRRGAHVELRDWFNPALGFALAGVVTLVLYAPLLLDVQKFFGGAPPAAARVATTGWAILEMLRGLQLGYATSGVIALGAALFLVGSWSYLRQSPIVLALFVAPGAVLLAATILLQRPTFPRFFFFLAGFALLIIVRGIVVAANWIARGLPSGAIGARLRPLLPAASIAAAAVVSLLALPAGYRYPKQDFEGALKFLAAHTASDVVVLAGIGVTVPFQKYYGKAWPRLASADQLTAARQHGNDVWLAYTFRHYIEALEPELMREVLTHCPTVRTFPGTLAGGSIVVKKCRAAEEPARPK